MKYWHRYLGLPFKEGADPEDGDGADCFLMVWRILETEGVPHPPFQDYWRRLAELGRADELEQVWMEYMKPIKAPREMALTFFKYPPRVGVGIVIDDGLLAVHNRRGVCWIPLSNLRQIQFWEFAKLT